MFIRILAFIVLILLTNCSMQAQIDSILKRTNFEMDFRFRAEQDWDSRKSDGTFREDRTRLRYRFRTGLSYKKDWYTVGFRIRTGDQRKQQDPQLTLGTGPKEFGTLPLGFEKIYLQGKLSSWKFWLGKNTFPFDKNNELFWSDNVFPEGVFVEKEIAWESSLIDNIGIKGGHFILSSNGQSLFEDAYFQGIQTAISIGDNRLKLFPSLYLFRNIPNIPDGDHDFFMDYSIFHFGSKIDLIKSGKLALDFDVYYNLQDYSLVSSIVDNLKDEKTAYTVGLRYGSLKKAKSWLFKLTLASIQKFAIVDFMAQNDWARWDYSSNNSPDGRLSNFNGAELVGAYAINKKMNLVVKYYLVEQIVPLGLTTETGQRIRFDINVKL